MRLTQHVGVPARLGRICSCRFVGRIGAAADPAAGHHTSGPAGQWHRPCQLQRISAVRALTIAVSRAIQRAHPFVRLCMLSVA